MPAPDPRPAAALAARLAPVLSAAHFELVDVEVSGAVVRVLVDRAAEHPLGGGRIDLDGVSEATRLVDAELESADPLAGAYTLEVSSPGLERPLRTAAHFAAHVGRTVKLKLAPPAAERRVEGVLEAADDTSITVAGRTFELASVESARTVFVWGAQPKPGGRGAKPKTAGPGRAATASGRANPASGRAAALPVPVPAEHEASTNDDHAEVAS